MTGIWDPAVETADPATEADEIAARLPGQLAHVAATSPFYRRLWAQGPAGVEVTLRMLQGRELREVKVRTMDRVDYFRSRPGT